MQEPEPDGAQEVRTAGKMVSSELAEPTEGELLGDAAAPLAAALLELVGGKAPRGWAAAARVCAATAHHGQVREQLWQPAGAAAGLVELAASAAAPDAPPPLGDLGGQLHAAAMVLAQAMELGAREPPRSLLQQLEAGPPPSAEERQDLRRRTDGLLSAAPPPVTSPPDGGDEMSDADRAQWRAQMVAAAADGNLDFSDLCQATSLPTLIKLLPIAQLSEPAAATICRIALRASPPDLRSAASRRLQGAGMRAKASLNLGLWKRPQTMTEMLDEAKWLVSEAAEAREKRHASVQRSLALPGATGQGEGEGEDGVGGTDRVTKEELTALIQKKVSWGFVGGSDRFRVRVRTKKLPPMDKRGPEHAIGEHHVSVAIWGKPGDVGEPVPMLGEGEQGKQGGDDDAGFGGVVFMSRRNTGKELCEDGERLLREMNQAAAARMRFAGIEEAGATKRKKPRGKPIVVVTKSQMSAAIASIASSLSVLQAEGRMDLLKLDISGCDLESSAVSALGRLRLCELGLWGGTDSAADGVAAMADGLLRQQQSGSLGPIKLRLVQCTLNATAEAAIEQLELVPPPPPPPSAPGEEYEQGGIPINIVSAAAPLRLLSKPQRSGCTE